MKTAIITGASKGLGAELALRVKRDFPEIECLWLIARSREGLTEVASRCAGPHRIIVFPLDLCRPESFDVLAERLEKRRPEVKLLVNNAGCGFLGDVGDSSLRSQSVMTELNVRALTAVTSAVLPYMTPGAKIVNISSIASFCPNPRMTVYSSTKAYVSFFSRGLGEELRFRGISVTAVCPGPMDTNFLDAGGVRGNSGMFEALPYCGPREVARGAFAAARAGRAVYTPGAFYKAYRVLAKLIPQAALVKVTKT